MGREARGAGVKGARVRSASGRPGVDSLGFAAPQSVPARRSHPVKRIPQLDGIRGIAILLVLVYHTVVLPIGTLTPGPFGNLARALGFCWSGVDLFFVLSGFLITGILWDNRGATNYFAVFYARRSSRIFPVYYLSLAAFWIFAATRWARVPAFSWLVEGSIPAWSYATFTQNILMGMAGHYGANWLAATWSLAVEEQFYLVVPLAVRFLSRRWLLALFGVAIVAAPFLRLATPGIGSYVYPWCRADALLSGACLALLVRIESIAGWIRFRRAWLIGFLGGCLGCGVLLKLVGVPQAWQHTLLAMAGVALVALGNLGSGTTLGFVLGSRFLVWFGKLSYGLYVYHQIVAGVFHAVVLGRGPHLGGGAVEWAVSAAGLAATLLLAVASERWLERPLLRWAQGIAYRRQPGEM